jgi:hypothetical protein
MRLALAGVGAASHKASSHSALKSASSSSMAGKYRQSAAFTAMSLKATCQDREIQTVVTWSKAGPLGVLQAFLVTRRTPSRGVLRYKRKVKFDGFERQYYTPVIRLINNAAVKQRMHIAVNGPHVTFDPARNLTDSQGPLPGHDFDNCAAVWA